MTANLCTRTALITGSSRGLGRHAALALAREGANVVVHYRHNKAAAEQVVQEARQWGGHVYCLAADVRDQQQVQNMIAAVQHNSGRLDILINNVGNFYQQPLLEMDGQAWHEMIDSNLHSVFYACQAVVPIMIEQGYGRIINVGVANADRIQAYVQTAAYAIAKTGVQILTRSLARETAGYGITVNMISPGLMASGAVSETEEGQARSVPMGRVGGGVDYSSAVLYLLSEGAQYVTGANIVVSGGWGL